MHIERLKTGMIEENCYLVYNEEALLIIDPGEDAERIKQEIKKTNQQPVAILLPILTTIISVQWNLYARIIKSQFMSAH